MQDGYFVIDSVAHGYDVSTANRAPQCPAEDYAAFASLMHSLGHAPIESPEPGFLLNEAEFTSQPWSAGALADAFFVESDVDVVFYHHVPISAYFLDGVSRLDTGFELQKLAPGRVFVYGGVDTFLEDRGLVFAQMEALAEAGCVGFKFYPSNGAVDVRSCQLKSMLYDSPDLVFPYFEKARSLGVTHLAFHKAMPLGPPLVGARIHDLPRAAAAFPDLTFEIVHAGWAFLEETALELMLTPNLYANLEVTGNQIIRQPRRFAHVLGTFLQFGVVDRLLFASGCAVSHPDPVLRAFAAFEMPESLRNGYGWPEVTMEMKAAILGGNMARLHGLDVEKMKRALSDDDWARRRAEGKAPPWGTRRADLARAGSDLHHA